MSPPPLILGAWEYFSLEQAKGKNIQSVLNKLHCQFGHPNNEKLKKLIVDAKMWKDEYTHILEDIRSKCRICLEFSRTPEKSVVSLPFANCFNEALCVDLKKVDGGYILHMIDMFSRYTRSVFVVSKNSTLILDKILQEWVGIFGVPRKLLSDCGGEFTSQEMREVSSHLNIMKYTTAAEAPWQNGLCERVHQVTDMILTKLKESYPNVHLETLLAWANMARNSLQMYNGFSSHQIVFGVNPNLPNVMYDELPSLEDQTSSEIFAKHLNILNAARKEFISSDANLKIKRALSRKLVRFKKNYETGNLVYYKRQASDRWLGPAKVIFQDNKILFLRHGMEFYRVSVNRVSPANCFNSNIHTVVCSKVLYRAV